MTDHESDTATTLLTIPRRFHCNKGTRGKHTDFELDLTDGMLRALADLIKSINNNAHRFRHVEAPKDDPKNQEEELCLQKP